MKRATLVIFLVLSLLLVQTFTQNVTQMTVEQLEAQRNLIEQQLAIHQDPWRWYHLVGIGIASLVGFNCIRCCLPFCLACCCGCVFFLIGFIRSLIKGDKQQRPDDLGYKREKDNKDKKEEMTDEKKQQNNITDDPYGYPQIEEEKVKLYPNLDKQGEKSEQRPDPYKFD